MKIHKRKKMLGLSLVTAMLLTTGAYSAQIIGADVTDPDNLVPAWEMNTQFGFGGLNLENITVNLITAEGNDPIVGTFDPETGIYPTMALRDSYQSDVFSRIDPATKLGYVTGKIWPIGEPAGIKVINNDGDVNKYKPVNCIMASTYLGDSNTSDSDDRTYYLDSDTPKPVLCSSYAGSSKRFQLVLNENMMTEIDGDGYGKHIDLVFNIDINSEDGDHAYQVFQKVTNHTGMRLDGLRVEVLNANGDPVTSDLNISLGLGEGNPADGGDIFKEYEMAFYPPGLWGDGTKEHLPIGWFDVDPSGYLVDGNGTSKITTGARLDGNYVEIYGNWLPAKWVGVGMHEEFSPTEEPALLAYWGTLPTEDLNDTPAWHYGMYNNENVLTDFASPTPEELEAWAADMKTEDNPDGKYVIDDIEDLPNLSLNYIVNVGANVTDKFIIRFTPKVSIDQTPPSYFERDGVTRIEPVLPTVDDGTDGTTDPDDGTTTPDDGTTDGTDDDTIYINRSGGGCTYNPNSKNFDMTFLLMMALGALYPFRRRFIK